MSESANNDQNNQEGVSQNTRTQANENSEQHPRDDPTVAIEMSSSVEDPNYWKKLVT